MQLSKKELAKLKRQAAAAAVSAVADDPLAANYGEIPLEDLQSKEVSGRKWTGVKKLTEELEGTAVLIRGRVDAIRAVGKKMAFVVVRGAGFTVQCVLTVTPDLVSNQMVKFASTLSKESVVDVEGIVALPSQPITGATQKQVEIQVRKFHCVSKAESKLPINIEDAARSDAEIDKALQAGKPAVRVNQDTRLNPRVLDIRTPANQGIFEIQSQFENLFRQLLLADGFRAIHTPKLIAGSSEGGAAVFRLDYKGTPACLAQ